MKEKYHKSIKINCSCGKSCTYTPKDPNNLPRQPRCYCSVCDKQFSIKRTKMIENRQFKRIDTFGKTIEKSIYNENINDEKIILELLEKGFYAQEISQKTSFSVSFLSKTIQSLKQRGVIIQIEGYPKKYKLANPGRPFLEKGIHAEEHIPKEEKEGKINANWIDKLRPHFYRFKNDLIYKPKWLHRISHKGIVRGLNVQKVELHNWSKFIIRFNYQDFNGLENVEICHNCIIYNFNRNIEEQYVYSKEDSQKYRQDRIQDCKNVRAFLEKQGFAIDKADPILCQKPHFAIESHGIPKALGTLGKELLLTIKTPSETKIIDDSPPKRGGEEETTDMEKAESIFDVPEKIDNLQKGLTKLNNKIENLENKLEKLVDTLTSLAEGSKPKKTKTEPEEGGMYQ